MAGNSQKMTRIGIFYDGNYFLHVSNYYAYHHVRRSRISIAGLHDFVCHKVAEEEVTDVKLCRIVDAHYFRSRLSAQEASSEGNRLYYDRLFDDILMSEGVTTQYLPIRSAAGPRQERDIDMWLAMEAYEQAITKQFSVVVLLAADGDFMPLVRKLNALGTRVMILSWDYEYFDEEGRRRSFNTSTQLINEASYPMDMHAIIDNPHADEEALVNALFVEKKKVVKVEIVEDEVMRSTIFSLKDGYGFISFPQTNNLFFHFSFLVDTDFNDLREGDSVEFSMSKNEYGEPIARNVKLVMEPQEVV